MAGSYNTFINVWLGSLEFINCTENMISIDNVLKTGTVAQSTVIELYDDTALVVEAELLKIKDRSVQFEYGYVNGLKSDKFKGTITKISTNFKGYSVILTLEVTGAAVVKAAETSDVKVYKKYKGIISNIAMQVAAEEGWEIAKVEPTEKDTEFEIERHNEPATYFINNVLAPKAVSQSGKGGYQFYLESSNGKYRMTFAPIDFKGSKKEKYEDLDLKSYQFTIGLPNETVIEFEADYANMLFAHIGASTTRAVSKDPNTNEEKGSEITESGALQKVLEGKGRGVTKIVRHVAGKGYDFQSLQTLAKALYDTVANLVYPATLSVVGNPTLKPMSIINILVMTREGQKHHTTGKYMITQVEHLLNGGSYVTNLTLLKNPGTRAVQTGYGGNSSGGQPPVNADGTFIEKVKKYLGIPYVYGGSDWPGFDCSGFVWHFLKYQMGSTAIGDRTSADVQMQRGTPVPFDSSYSQLQPGDLLFTEGGNHVVMWVGNGTVVHAPKTGDVIKYSNLWFTPVAVRRYI